MRDYVTKADNTAPSPSGILGAEEDNVRFEEGKQAVVTAGISLDAVGGPNTDQKMLAQALARYASGGVFGVDRGAANAYVVGNSGSYVVPKALSDGMQVLFYPAYSNTGASTLNAYGLGARALRLASGLALAGGEIITHLAALAIYSEADGFFKLAPWSNMAALGIGTPPSYTVATGFRNMVVWTTPGVYSWTVPAGVTKVYVEGAAGGGGGGNSAGNYDGGGGGGGGWFEGFFNVTPANGMVITVGAGGAGALKASPSPGITGGTTSFDVLATALGGAGGIYANNLPGIGGDGGTASGGQINITGQTGDISNAPSANSNYPRGGSCGRFGAGGINSSDGVMPGSGGGPSGNGLGGVGGSNAGKGGDGLLTIKW